MAEPVRSEQRIDLAIAVVGWLIVLTSFGHMDSLTWFDRYRESFSFLSPETVSIRYAGSWIQRILGLLAGIGIIYRYGIARRTIIALSIFNLATAYWKHPFASFHKEMLARDLADPGFFERWGMPGTTFVSLTWHVTIAALIYEIACFSFLLYFFFRPDVKGRFR